jgi:isochorismate synthase
VVDGPLHEGVSAALPALRAVFQGASGADVDPAVRARAFGGFRFAPVTGATPHDPAWDAFGGWRFVVPAVLVAWQGDRVVASVTLAGAGDRPDAVVDRAVADLRGGGDDDPGLGVVDGLPDASERLWLEQVRRAIGEIREGAYDKLVLARRVTLRRAASIDRPAVLSYLARTYRHCFVFSSRADGSTWLGATPELLCRVRGASVETASLAGSRPRSDDPERDAALAAELLDSPKERAEHDMVTVAIREALAPLCTRLDLPQGPGIVTLPNIRHLNTPIAGQLRRGVRVLDVVAAMHPTPAVGWSPRSAGIGALERIEQLDRGWYAGPVGWFDADGDGEFAVGLRSALVTGCDARLYAGAGIVASSVPEQEYAETETKLAALRNAIEARVAFDAPHAGLRPPAWRARLVAPGRAVGGVLRHRPGACFGRASGARLHVGHGCC